MIQGGQGPAPRGRGRQCSSVADRGCCHTPSRSRLIRGSDPANRVAPTPQSRGRSIPVSSFGLPVPQPPEYPPAAQPDELYKAELSRRIHARQDNVVDRFLELVADQCYRTDNNPLAVMHALLSGPGAAPIQDLCDARQYSSVGRPDDASLARLVRFLYAQANLTVAEQVRGELSGVDF
jgi:hypothetical protein